MNAKKITQATLVSPTKEISAAPEGASVLIPTAEQMKAAAALLAAGRKAGVKIGPSPEALARYEAAKKELIAAKAAIGTGRGGAMSESAKASISEGFRLRKLAGSPTRDQMKLVYGEAGLKKTWPELNALIPAEQFQARLKAALAGKS